MTAVFRHPARESKHTLAAAANAGDIVQDDDGKAGVVSGLNVQGQIGDEVALQTGGIFEVASDSATTFAAGALVDIDSNQEVVANPGGDFPIGRAHKGKTAGQTTAMIDLNGTGPSA